MVLTYYLAGRFDTAVEWAGRAVHRMPQGDSGHSVLATSLRRTGRHETAHAAVASCHEVLPDVSVADLDRIPLSHPAAMEAFRENLREAGPRDCTRMYAAAIGASFLCPVKLIVPREAAWHANIGGLRTATSYHLRSFVDSEMNDASESNCDFFAALHRDDSSRTKASACFDLFDFDLTKLNG